MLCTNSQGLAEAITPDRFWLRLAVWPGWTSALSRASHCSWAGYRDAHAGDVGLMAGLAGEGAAGGKEVVGYWNRGLYFLWILLSGHGKSLSCNGLYGRVPG
jgi:hypothetical protein